MGKRLCEHIRQIGFVLCLHASNAVTFRQFYKIRVFRKIDSEYRSSKSFPAIAEPCQGIDY